LLSILSNHLLGQIPNLALWHWLDSDIFGGLKTAKGMRVNGLPSDALAGASYLCLRGSISMWRCPMKGLSLATGYVGIR